MTNMENTSGRTKGLHTVPDYTKHTFRNFVFNCHICNSTFSPVEITLRYLPKRFYRFGVWCRLAKIMELDRAKICNCDPNMEFITLYDNVDPAMNDFKSERTEDDI